MVATPLAVELGEILPQGAGEQESDHVTPLFARSLLTVAVNCVAVFPGTVTLPGRVFTTIASTVTAVPARAGGSATEVAVIVTCRSAAGGGGGAAYVVGAPFAVETGETLPHDPIAQDTAQVTPLLLASLVSVAVRVIAPPAGTVLADEATLIATDGTVIVAELDFVVSAIEVADSVTAKSFAGGLLGTVYVTLAPLNEEVGETVPHGGLEQLTVQVTPEVLLSFTTVAENCAVPPIWTVANAGDTVTAIAGEGVGAWLPPQPIIVSKTSTPLSELSKDARHFKRRFMGHLPLHSAR